MRKCECRAFSALVDKVGNYAVSKGDALEVRSPEIVGPTGLVERL